MRRNNQFSIRPSNFDFASNGEWTKDLSVDQHYLFKSYDESILFTNLIVPFKPDQLVTFIEIEQKLIEYHNVMSISLCWCYNA
jgi:hypothetical protein